MGFISTLIVRNDFLGEIWRDKEFGYKISRAILALPSEKPTWIVGNWAAAVETHHNSGVVPVLIGRSTGLPLSVAWEPRDGEDPEISLLKRLADRHGFRLSRKPRRTA